MHISYFGRQSQRSSAARAVSLLNSHTSYIKYKRYASLLRIQDVPFAHFAELKIRVRLKFQVLFSPLESFVNTVFPEEQNGLTERAANCMEGEIYLLANIFSRKIPF